MDVGLSSEAALALLVNDDLTQRKILARALAKAGCQVSEFEDPVAALEAVDAGVAPDLVVTDLSMPRMDGWEFCRRLRSGRYQRLLQVPILVVSATDAIDEAHQLADELGVNGFFPCPVDLAALISQVKALLAAPGPSDHPFAVVVNDDSLQRHVLVSLTRQCGYEVAGYPDPVEALSDLAVGRKPDLIITDLCMPRMDGWQFCRLLRSEECPVCNDVPILVVSATYAGDEAASITAELGANAFLSSPVDAARLRETVRRVTAGESPQWRPRLLLVDDSPTTTRLLAAALETNGYEVDRAGDGQAALDLVATQRFELAVVDYHLPDLTGDAVMEAILARQPECACLMMTADPTPELAVTWLGRGAAAYLRKPFAPAHLLEVCSRVRRERALMRIEARLEERTQALREREELYRTLVERSVQGVVLERHGQVVYANPAFAQIVGQAPAELLGKPLERALRLPAATPECVRCSVGEPDERQCHLWCSATPVTFQGQPATMRIFTDITADENTRRSLHGLLQSAPVGLATVADGVVTEANPAFAELLGLVPAALVGTPFQEVLPPAAEWCQTSTDHRVAQGQPGVVTCHLETTDAVGVGRALEVTVAPSRHCDAGQCATLAVVDVTERTRSERLLQQQRELAARLFERDDLEATLALCLDAAMDLSGLEVGGIYLADPDTTDLHLAVHHGLSEALLAAAGCCREGSRQHGLVQTKATRYLTEPELAGRLAAREGLRCLAVVPIVHQERPIGCLNLGSHELTAVPAAVRPAIEAVVLQMGQAIGWQQARQAERIQADNLALLFASITDALFVMSPDGILLDVNPAACEMLDYQRDELLGQPVAMVHPADRVDEVQTVVAAMLAGEVDSCLIPLARRDGSEVPVETRIVIGRWNGQEAVFGVSRDVSELLSREMVLRDSQEQLGLALQVARMGYWRWDAATNEVFWYGQHHELFGLAEGEFAETLDSLQELVHPDDRDHGLAAIERTLHDDVPFDNTYRVIHPDGSTHWLHSFGHLNRDETGAPRFMFGVTQDITAVETYCRQMEAMAAGLRAVLEATDELILTADLDTYHRRAVELAREKLGLDRCVLFLYDPARERYLATYGTDAAGQTTDEREFWIGVDRQHRELTARFKHDGQRWLVREDCPLYYRGEVVGFGQHVITAVQTGSDMIGMLCHDNLLSGNPLTAEQLELVAIYGSLLGNILSRKRAEAELRASEARQRATVAALPDLLFQFDAAGRFTNWAAGSATGLLLPPEAFLGRTVEEVLPPELASLTREKLTAALAGGSVQFYDYDLEIDGATRTFEARMVISGPDEVLAVVRDVTAQRSLEEQLRQAQKLESVGRLAGGVAHDYNNMLAVILGNAELVLRSLPPGDPAIEDLEQIQHAAQRSADLTSQLLAFARKQMVNPRVIDLNATVAESLRMLGRLIGEDIAVRWQPAADLWPVRMDPVQVNQILANLALNARDAIDDVGALSIASANLALSEPTVWSGMTLLPGDWVVLTFSDTGHGMDEETLAHVFEPFFTTKAVGKGTGLGLATVYGIVKQAAGMIAVSSEPGVGTTFQIALPRAAEQPGDRQDTSRRPARDGSGLVLLVEDEPSVLRLAERALTSHGFQVLTASSGAAALELSEQHPEPIDLLLTDVIMPGMNGRELQALIQVQRPGLRVLFMSGHPEDVIADRSLLEPGTAFIAKPFAVAELVDRVRELLEL